MVPIARPSYTKRIIKAKCSCTEWMAWFGRRSLRKAGAACVLPMCRCRRTRRNLLAFGEQNVFCMARYFVHSYCRSAPSAFASPSVFRRGLSGIFIGMAICRRRFWPGPLPEPLGNWQGIDLEPLSPGDFITGLMQLPMMAATKRNGELVADFQAQRPWLGKPQVMRIGRLPSADPGGLRGHEPQIGFVTQPLRW
jgi:hypothetical protein